MQHMGMTSGKGTHSRGDQKLGSHHNTIFMPVKELQIAYMTWEVNHQDQSEHFSGNLQKIQPQPQRPMKNIWNLNISLYRVFLYNFT